MSAPGPYQAAFGAIHHASQSGYFFTVTPASAADEVARALNLAHAQDNSPPGEEGEPAAYVVWNGARNEGVIFVKDSDEPELSARRDALQASTGVHGFIGSSLAEQFYEAYEDDEDRPIVELTAAQLAALIP